MISSSTALGVFTRGTAVFQVFSLIMCCRVESCVCVCVCVCVCMCAYVYIYIVYSSDMD